MVSRPELGSDPSFGSGRELGRDKEPRGVIQKVMLPKEDTRSCLSHRLRVV